MLLFSTVQAKIKRRLLSCAIIFGACGCFLLLGMGAFAPVKMLKIWGIPSFTTAIFLIGFGMIPYRKLIRLETHPHKILLEKSQLIFISTHGNQIELPYHLIKKVTPVERKNRYGLLIDIKNRSPLFFPYFLADPRLDEIVHSDEPHHLF